MGVRVTNYHCSRLRHQDRADALARSSPSRHLALVCFLFMAVVARSVSLAADTASSEPREVITLGRICAHNDGAGLLSAEVTFRYPPNEIVLFDPAKLGPDGAVLLVIEWHLRDQTPVRTLSSHLEAVLTIENQPNRDPQTDNHVKDFGQDLPPASTYNQVDSFEQKITLTRKQPIWVVRLTGKAMAEAKLDRKLVGPEGRATFFVRQVAVGTPEESAALSRIFAGAYRQLHQMEGLLQACSQYLNELQPQVASVPSREKTICDVFQQALRDYAVQQAGVTQDAETCVVDWGRWNSFFQVDPKTQPPLTPSDAQSARTQTLTVEIGRRIAAGLRDDSARPLVVTVVPRLAIQLDLQRMLSNCLHQSRDCRAALLRMFAAESRADLSGASGEYDYAWNRLLLSLNLLRDALAKSIGFSISPFASESLPTSDFSISLKPVSECLAAQWIPPDCSDQDKQLGMDAIRARLLPMWLYLETNLLAQFTEEQRFMLASIAPAKALIANAPESTKSPDARISTTLPSPGVSVTATVSATASLPAAKKPAVPIGDSFSPGPKMSVDTHGLPPVLSAVPKRNKVMTQKKTSLPDGKIAARDRSQRSPTPSAVSPTTPVPAVTKRKVLFQSDFSTGLGGWSKRDPADRHPGKLTADLEGGEGHSYLVLRRTGSALTLGSVELERSLNLSREELQQAFLEMQFEIEEQALPGGGSLGLDFPLQIELSYVDKAENEHLWRFGFCASGSISQWERALRVESGVWTLWKTVALTSLLPDMQRLKAIKLYGSGWDFESRVRSLEIAREE